MGLQFDTLLEKDYTNPGMNDDDYQIGLSLGDFDQVPPVAYAWFNGPENIWKDHIGQISDLMHEK